MKWVEFLRMEEVGEGSWLSIMLPFPMPVGNSYPLLGTQLNGTDYCDDALRVAIEPQWKSRCCRPRCRRTAWPRDPAIVNGPSRPARPACSGHWSRPRAKAI